MQGQRADLPQSQMPLARLCRPTDRRRYSVAQLQPATAARAAICCQAAAVSQEKARIREAMLTKVGEVIQPGANYCGLDFAIIVRSKGHLEHVDIMSQTTTIKMLVLSCGVVLYRNRCVQSNLTLYHPAWALDRFKRCPTTIGKKTSTLVTPCDSQGVTPMNQEIPGVKMSEDRNTKFHQHNW